MLSLVLLAACSQPETPPLQTGSGLFLNGCPEAGKARARVIEHPRERPTGYDSLAKPGDLLLMNEAAAFVISGFVNPQTYYHYPGIPIDAVAVDGCEQAAPERFGELGLMIGELNLADFNQSNLHMFHGHTAELIQEDDGTAIVEVSGTDDWFPLVDLTLVKEAFLEGGFRRPSKTWGLDITVRYVLEPGSPVLGIEMDVAGERRDELIAGTLLFPSDTTPRSWFADGRIDVGSLGLETEMPWIGMADDDGAYALNYRGANMGQITISGTTAIAKLEPGLPLQIDVGVGASDLNSATRHVSPYALREVQGVVRDDEGPAADAIVDIQTQNKDGEWRFLDQARPDAFGQFTAMVPSMRPVRFVGHGPGRWAGPPASKPPVRVGNRGEVAYRILDNRGREVPAKLDFYDAAGSHHLTVFATPAQGVAPVPPGTWSVSVTRGYEYVPDTVDIEVPEGGRATLRATLDRVVDTSGYLSMDSHVHQTLSPDSEVLLDERARSAAAAGLEVIIATDHEAINDIYPGVEQAGVQRWVNTVVGQEVTATMPEHHNAWPFPLIDNARGEPPKWPGLDHQELMDAIRERGAPIIQLNHPRSTGGCGWLCTIDWNRKTGRPNVKSGRALGMDADATLFSSDFNAIEIMNSLRDPFHKPSDPRDSGVFDDWLSFHNHGQRVTATAVTDVHGANLPGSPRNWFASRTDDPQDFVEEDLVNAMLQGDVVVSAGAFARVSVEGAGMGETARVDDGLANLYVRIEAIPEVDVTRFMVFANCDEVLTASTRNPDGVVKHNEVIPIPVHEDSTIAVVGFGENPMPRGLKNYDPTFIPRFITNVIFVDTDGGGFDPVGGKSCSYDVGR